MAQSILYNYITVLHVSLYCEHLSLSSPVMISSIRVKAHLCTKPAQSSRQGDIHQSKELCQFNQFNLFLCQEFRTCRNTHAVVQSFLRVVPAQFELFRGFNQSIVNLSFQDMVEKHYSLRICLVLGNADSSVTLFSLYTLMERICKTSRY